MWGRRGLPFETVEWNLITVIREIIFLTEIAVLI